MKARRWVVQSLASAVVLASLAGGSSAQGQPNKPAAVVDGTVITMAEVEAALKQSGPNATALPEGQRRQMQMEAVSMLIDDLLLQQFLRKYAPRIAPAEVDKKLAEIVESLKKQNKTLKDLCDETKQTEAQLRINLLNLLQWDIYVKQHLTEAGIKRYYDENREFFDRIMVRASHIVTRISPAAVEAERKKAHDRLVALRQEIISGRTDFAAAAKKNSECTSAANGGDIGYFPRKLAIEEPFARAAFALKIGEISAVVQTNYGLHLIKVTDRKPGQPSDYNKIKDDVKELCVEEMRLAVLEQQRKTSRVQINLP
jgi:peptidyl-prolyl cis-trans isomerase C